VIENAGIARSMAKMRAADLVIYLFDVNEASPTELVEIEEDLSAQGIKYLLVGNKIDVGGENKARNTFEKCPGVLFISARESAHIDDLKTKMASLVMEGQVQAEGTVVTNARHFESLQRLESALRAVQKGLNENLTGDLLAPDIRSCLQYLGEITGEITSEDQLDYIFSKFCIGK